MGVFVWQHVFFFLYVCVCLWLCVCPFSFVHSGIWAVKRSAEASKPANIKVDTKKV